MSLGVKTYFVGSVDFPQTWESSEELQQRFIKLRVRGVWYISPYFSVSESWSRSWQLKVMWSVSEQVEDSRWEARVWCCETFSGHLASTENLERIYVNTFLHLYLYCRYYHTRPVDTQILEISSSPIPSLPAKISEKSLPLSLWSGLMMACTFVQ